MRHLILLAAGLVLANARIIDDSESDETALVFAREGADFAARDPAEVGYVNTHAHCQCCSHGCWCHAVIRGRSVNIFLSKDEADPDNKNQVVVSITIGRYSSSRKLDVSQTTQFCIMARRLEFCFTFELKEMSQEMKVATCMTITKPKLVKFDCVDLPMIESYATEMMEDASNEEIDLYFD